MSDPLYWEDVLGHYYACASIAQGDGYWPSMISCDFEVDGTITSGCARELAAMLVRAADACDQSTATVMP
jgi:hypothetical protein